MSAVEVRRNGADRERRQNAQKVCEIDFVAIAGLAYAQKSIEEQERQQVSGDHGAEHRSKQRARITQLHLAEHCNRGLNHAP